MITTKEIKIKRNNEFSSEYIEQQLTMLGLDVLRWAVVDCNDETYTLSLAIVEN